MKFPGSSRRAVYRARWRHQAGGGVPVGLLPRCNRSLRLASLGVICVAALLAGCATHRSEPPRCKGPFTPINELPVTAK